MTQQHTLKNCLESHTCVVQSQTEYEQLLTQINQHSTYSYEGLQECHFHQQNIELPAEMMAVTSASGAGTSLMLNLTSAMDSPTTLLQDQQLFDNLEQSSSSTQY